MALLKALDDNEDGAISLTEWTAALQAMLPEGLDLHAFDQFMAPLILKGSAYLSDPTNDAAAPQWPLGSRAYLQTALGSALQDGLAALLEHMAVEHVKVRNHSPRLTNLSIFSLHLVRCCFYIAQGFTPRSISDEMWPAIGFDTYQESPVF